MRATLEGDRVRLRPLTDDDLPRRAVWTSDDELAVLMGADPAAEPFVSPEDEVRGNREWLTGRKRVAAVIYAIVAEGEYIGDIDVTILAGDRRAELTLFIGDRTRWGSGYGTETVRLVTQELFGGGTVDRIDVDVAPGNERAYRFWRKLGFEDLATDARGTRSLRLQRAQAPGVRSQEKESGHCVREEGSDA